MDLYRLSTSDDLSPLNLSHVIDHCISLIEWPQSLHSLLPEDRLDIQVNILPSSSDAGLPTDEGDVAEDDVPRRILLRPVGETWADRIRQLLEDGSIEDLLA
jgi:tRNA A37 threonylcarbamoyladenosine biosynthesis protein TsaE